MRPLIIIFFLFTSVTCFGQMTRDTEPTAPAYFFTPALDSLDYKLEARVYMATNAKVKTYHWTQNCQSLKKYKQKLVALRESEAKQERLLTACQKCSKK
jgi:hypothetical protein